MSKSIEVNFETENVHIIGFQIHDGNCQAECEKMTIEEFGQEMLGN